MILSFGRIELYVTVGKIILREIVVISELTMISLSNLNTKILKPVPMLCKKFKFVSFNITEK